MGADGGTIPKRCELVKEKKKKEKVEKSIRNASRWRLCRLSQQPLKKPIVACRLGGLYNKEAVLDAILTKKIGENANAKHIRGLKDIKELKLTDNKEFSAGTSDKSDVYKDHNLAPFCCPVTSLAMNGNYAFTVNWQCGCVISEKAINEVKSDVCHGCGGAFDPEGIITLNPEADLLRKYELKLAEEREKRKARKAENAQEDAVNGVQKPVVKKPNPAKAEKRKAASAESSSIQDDANASAAYKSLFTTCEEAKKKPKAHWVTYNPLFY